MVDTFQDGAFCGTLKKPAEAAQRKMQCRPPPDRFRFHWPRPADHAPCIDPDRIFSFLFPIPRNTGRATGMSRQIRHRRTAPSCNTKHLLRRLPSPSILKMFKRTTDKYTIGNPAGKRQAEELAADGISRFPLSRQKKISRARVRSPSTSGKPGGDGISRFQDNWATPAVYRPCSPGLLFRRIASSPSRIS